jgi:cell division protease FtsH
MADEMGPVTYGQEDQPIFLGKEIARHKDYSEETAQLIDRAIKRILENAQKKADEILRSRKEELEKISEELLARETLLDDEVRALIGLPPRENYSSLSTPPAPSEAVSPEAKAPEMAAPEDGSPPEA